LNIEFQNRYADDNLGS